MFALADLASQFGDRATVIEGDSHCDVTIRVSEYPNGVDALAEAADNAAPCPE